MKILCVVFLSKAAHCKIMTQTHLEKFQLNWQNECVFMAFWKLLCFAKENLIAFLRVGKSPRLQTILEFGDTFELTSHENQFDFFPKGPTK